jgi:hypothetical protein
MFERRVLPILLLASVLPAAAAPAVPASKADVPSRFSAGLDGGLVYAEDATSGAVWAAWAYRSRGEYDIAVSVRDLSGVWSEPTFIGHLDGLDQSAPAMAFDADGNLYLAFAALPASQILLSVRPRGASTWSAPLLVTSPAERGFSPALAATADRLVLAYRTIEGRVALRFLPLLAQTNQVRGIYDNPDGTDPLGMTNNGGTAPTTSSSGFGPPLTSNGPKK